MKQKNKYFKLLMISVMIVCFALVATGCMPGDGSYVEGHEAGLLSGIWHGWIAPISLIRGIFNNNIRIYEAVNKGWSYDFGFYIAVISGFGGISLFRKKKKED